MTAVTIMPPLTRRLYVPLVKDDRALGVFVIFRQEVRPFTDKQMALKQIGNDDLRREQAEKRKR